MHSQRKKSSELLQQTAPAVPIIADNRRIAKLIYAFFAPSPSLGGEKMIQNHVKFRLYAALLPPAEPGMFSPSLVTRGHSIGELT
jgi:hypothetical protein